MAQKIRLGTYPYAYVRSVTMRSKLFKKNDYDKLLKMDINEITKYMQESNYADEINQLAIKQQGITLLEQALELNLSNSLEKLKRISPEELNFLLEVYLKRNDITNIKTILRAIVSKVQFSDAQSMLKRGVEFTQDDLQQFYEKQSVQEIITALKFFEHKEIEALLEKYSQTNSLLIIENALDKHYYKSTFDVCNRIASGASLYKAYLQAEIDAINLKNIIRLKKENLPNEQIVQHLFDFGITLKHEQINSLLKCEFEGMLKKLTKHKEFGKIVAEHLEELKQNQLVSFETALAKYLLNKASSLMRKNPLSGEVILGFMLTKEIEVRNIKAIIKAKQLGIESEYVAEQLVV